MPIFCRVRAGGPGRGPAAYSEFVQISHTLLCAEIGGNQNDEIGAGPAGWGRGSRQPSDIDWRCYWTTVGGALAQFRSRILECENGWRQTKWTERFRFCSISCGLCLDAALSSCHGGMLGGTRPGSHSLLSTRSLLNIETQLGVSWTLSLTWGGLTHSPLVFSSFAKKSAQTTKLLYVDPTGLKGFPFLVKFGWS